MHNRIGPWHTLTVAEVPGGRDYSITHPGQTSDAECPETCELRRDIARRTIDLLDDRFGDLPVGEYRLRSQWSDGLLQNSDGTDIVYPDPLADIEPLDIDPDVLERLVDVGNAERNHHYHERACGCRQYPHGCASNIALGIHDTDAFGISLRHVLAAYERLRAS